jgi:hypothetical protein
VIGGEVERLVRGVAEEILEELADAAPQVDSPRSGEQAALPHHDSRNIDDRLACFAPGEQARGAIAERSAARSMEDQRVGVGDRRLRVSHAASSWLPRARHTWPADHDGAIT